MDEGRPSENESVNLVESGCKDRCLCVPSAAQSLNSANKIQAWFSLERI